MRWRRVERMKWVKCEKVEREGRRNEKKGQRWRALRL